MLGFYPEATAREIYNAFLQLKGQVGNAQRLRGSTVEADDGITFHNRDTASVPPYGLVRVDNYALLQGVPVPSCKLPDATWGMDWLVNGGNTVEPDGLGRAQRGPIVIFAYDGAAPATGDKYGPKPGQATAAKNYPALLRAMSTWDSDAKLATGFWLPMTGLVGKASGAEVSARATTTPGTGTMAIWYDDAGTLTDTGMTVVVKNLLTTTMAEGDFFSVTQAEGDFWVVGGGSTGTRTGRIFVATLASTLLYSDSTASVTPAPADPVNNILSLAGLSGDVAVWAEEVGVDGEWVQNFLLNVLHHNCPTP